MSSDLSLLKQQAAICAVERVESGMVLGLGSGSTAILAIRRIGELLADGRLTDLVGVPTSQVTADVAQRVNIPLVTLADYPVVDLTIDGADEVDPHLNLIKGGGGALLREKIVAESSHQLLIIVDDSKLSPALGTTWPVPVEVVSFGWRSLLPFLNGLGAVPRLRLTTDGQPFLTDHGNFILDCHFGPLRDPVELAALLKGRTGIVEHGLFVGLASEVIVASADGLRRLVP